MKVHVIGGPAAGKVLNISHGSTIVWPVLPPLDAPVVDCRNVIIKKVVHNIHTFEIDGEQINFSVDENLSAFDAFNLLWREYESHCISKTEG